MNVEGVLTLDNVDLQGRTVLFRVDVNSPIEPSSGELLDDGRLRAIVPTLNRIQSSRVVLLAHQSRPGKADFTSMRKHSERLSEIIGRSGESSLIFFVIILFTSRSPFVTGVLSDLISFFNPFFLNSNEISQA